MSGSTYHSVLGINGYQANESIKTISGIYERLKDVKYVFLDEISMLDCSNIYAISSQMSLAIHVHDKPFGGNCKDLMQVSSQVPIDED